MLHFARQHCRAKGNWAWRSPWQSHCTRRAVVGNDAALTFAIQVAHPPYVAPRPKAFAFVFVVLVIVAVAVVVLFPIGIVVVRQPVVFA